MTPSSIGIALVVALLSGGVGGWLQRERVQARSLAFAASVAIGLVLVRSSSAADFFAQWIPTTGIHWVPWICLAIGVARCVPKRLFLALVLFLGVAAPVRLLWGSVYLRDATQLQSTLPALSVWVVFLTAAISMREAPLPRRATWQSTGWGLLFLSAALAIASYGSVTYAIATGVVATAALGHLLGSRRFPMEASWPLLLLLGLSVAYAELPFFFATLLGLTAVAFVWSSAATKSSNSTTVDPAAIPPAVAIDVRNPARRRFSTLLSVGSAATLFACITWSAVAFQQAAEELGGYDDGSDVGYGSTQTAPAINLPSSSSNDASAVAEAAPSEAAQLPASTEESIPGPFSGFPQP